MKIGIITFHFPINYGAVLQTYALYKTLVDMGHNVEIINYQPDYHTGRYKWKWKNGGFVPTNFIYPFLQKKFELFVTTHLKLTPKFYRSIEDLNENPPEDNAYICGSDQIWNPQLTNLDPAYFLEFGSKDVRRIAYAGSFGKTTFTQDQQDYLRLFFNKFNHISVREESGKALIETICQRDAEWVLDPTLLIDDYSAIAESKFADNKYVLLINIQNNQLLSRVANFISREKKLPIIIINNFSLKLWEQKGKRRFPGPGGYISAIQNAAFVVTNSFHGTIFSILLKRPFLTTALLGNDFQKNNRITGLLATCHLSEYFINNFDEVNLKKIIKLHYNWNKAKNHIDKKRESSLSFLKTALS